MKKGRLPNPSRFPRRLHLPSLSSHWPGFSAIGADFEVSCRVCSRREFSTIFPRRPCWPWSTKRERTSLLLVAPILASAWVGALAGNLVQGLPNIATKAFKPKWEKLNPAKGLQKLRTKANPAEWARFFVLLSALIVALWQTLGGNWDELMRSPGIPIEAGNALLREILIRVLTYVVLTLIVLAVIDFFYQKYQFEKNLKQSKSEVKEDNKADGRQSPG